MLWLLYSLLSALCSAFAVIYGKIAFKGVDTTMALTLRATIIAVILLIVATTLNGNQWSALQSWSTNTWFYILLTSAAGAASLFFYFSALKLATTSKVTIVDRLSLLFVIVLSAIILKEPITFKTVIGSLLMITGAYFAIVA